MPPGDLRWFPNEEILCYDELIRVIRVAAKIGISKIRITGGEPLVRPNLHLLIAEIKKIPGINEVAITTNGSLLGRYAESLRVAGLDRVNVSLDSLQRTRFHKITGHDQLNTVMTAIETALRVGLTPIKLNMVAMRGINSDEIVDFAKLSLESPYQIRFIEYMPFQNDSNLLVPVREMKKAVADLGQLIEEPYWDGPARVFRLKGAKGTIGFISPVTDHFCRWCNRIRLTADGRVKPCLLSNHEFDLRKILRSGVSDHELQDFMKNVIYNKPLRHDLGSLDTLCRGMFQTGG